MPIIMGIDPGSRFTGYGLVEKKRAGLSMITAGRISVKAKAPLSERLLGIYEGLREITDKYSPDAAAVEDIFYAKNIKSAIRLGHVRGVALMAAAAAGLPVFEYPATSIKMAVVGYGRADKSQVGLMVGKILNVKEALEEDASDALAAAICHINQNPALQGSRR